MKFWVVVFLGFVNLCCCEWVALPSVSPESVIKAAREVLDGEIKISNMSGRRRPTILRLNHDSFEDEKLQADEFCLGIHNLTMMTYGKKEKGQKMEEGGLPDFKEDFPKSAGGKYAFLKALESKIMGQIESRISHLEPSEGRTARLKHLGIHSMESALISISLLLFAVYLIKLVMKILHHFHAKRYQNNQFMNVPFPVVGRKKRSYDFEAEKIQLLHLIDKYNLRFR